jgi:hypothetical protein
MSKSELSLRIIKVVEQFRCRDSDKAFPELIKLGLEDHYAHAICRFMEMVYARDIDEENNEDDTIRRSILFYRYLVLLHDKIDPLAEAIEKARVDLYDEEPVGYA